MQTWPPGLERKAETETSHEWVDGQRWFQIAAAIGSAKGELGHFGNYGLRVCQIEEVHTGNQAPAFIEDKLAREAQVELIHAGQALDSVGLKDDVFAENIRFGMRHRNICVRNQIGSGWLNGEACIVLEVDAGADFPGQLVGAVHFET